MSKQLKIVEVFYVGLNKSLVFQKVGKICYFMLKGSGKILVLLSYKFFN